MPTKAYQRRLSSHGLKNSVQGTDPAGGLSEALHLEPGERPRDGDDWSRPVDPHPEHRGECESLLELFAFIRMCSKSH